MTPDTLFHIVLRRMAWRHALPWLARCLAVALLAAAAVLLAARLAAWPHGWLWAAIAAALVIVGGVVLAWLTRPAPAAALRRADQALCLSDRLSTAWEFREHQSPIMHLQR